jgi:hypothetical protein
MKEITEWDVKVDAAEAYLVMYGDTQEARRKADQAGALIDSAQWAQAVRRWKASERREQD